MLSLSNGDNIARYQTRADACLEALMANTPFAANTVVEEAMINFVLHRFTEAVVSSLSKIL